MKLPRITGKEMCKIASKIGFYQKRQKGIHSFWAHPDGRTTTIPIHPGKELPRGMVRKILNDIEMPVSEYLEHLKKI
jgi:predicted RNA binding protein YcfA (HicA-like mRNA interferase family)